jgi:hypothetical protein
LGKPTCNFFFFKSDATGDLFEVIYHQCAPQEPALLVGASDDNVLPHKIVVDMVHSFMAAFARGLVEWQGTIAQNILLGRAGGLLRLSSISGH